METPSFDGACVLALESRRAREMAALIENFKGRPLTAPALREVPMEANADALRFAEGLLRGDFDIVIFLTGVGTRALLEVIEAAHSRDAVHKALERTKVVARGPKPLAVLRELQIPIWVTAPEPNTWREVLSAIDAQAQAGTIRGLNVAVQEYGVSNPELLDGLAERGARVTRVPVYRWALPEDIAPLRHAVKAMADGTVDVALFTSSMQVVHLWEIAAQLGLQVELRRALGGMAVASIGPTTSEELRRLGVEPDFEASHPKMGLLVREAAERAPELLRTKRGRTGVANSSQH
jgi:uroporphyrinogen-III synthase